MDRSTKQKISKETQALNDKMDRLDLQDLSPKTMNFTFFVKCTWKLLRIDHILGHKSSLGKLKKILKSLQALFLITMW